MHVLILMVLIPVVLRGAWSSRRQPGRARIAWAAGAAALVVVALLVAALAPAHGYSLGKVVGRLLMPLSLLWLALWAAAAVCWWTQARGTAAALLAAWIGVTLAGSNVVAAKLMHGLEAAYLDPAVLDLEHDVIWVLGGGTTSGHGQVWLGFSGDRVAQGARLWHRGRAPLLVTSGSTPPGGTSGHNSAEATLTIWRELGVDPGAVILVETAHNTREEVVRLNELVSSHGWRRVGLLTSAWHLRRAMALVERSPLGARDDVVITPLFADSRSGGSRSLWSLDAALPSGDAFFRIQTASWEYVGRWTGR